MNANAVRVDQPHSTPRFSSRSEGGLGVSIGVGVCAGKLLLDLDRLANLRLRRLAARPRLRAAPSIPSPSFAARPAPAP